jgi:hypothetical protein
MKLMSVMALGIVVATGGRLADAANPELRTVRVCMSRRGNRVAFLRNR